MNSPTPILLTPQFLVPLSQVADDVTRLQSAKALIMLSPKWNLNTEAPLFMASVEVINGYQKLAVATLAFCMTPDMKIHMDNVTGHQKSGVQIAEIFFLRLTKRLEQALNCIVNFHMLPPVSGGEVHQKGFTYKVPYEDGACLQWLFLDGFKLHNLPDPGQHPARKEMIQ